MEDTDTELRFEEIGDDDDWNLDSPPPMVGGEEEVEKEEEEEDPFTVFYNPIRAAFSADSALVDSFSAATSHHQRLELLLGMDQVRSLKKMMMIIIIIIMMMMMVMVVMNPRSAPASPSSGPDVTSPQMRQSPLRPRPSPRPGNLRPSSATELTRNTRICPKLWR